MGLARAPSERNPGYAGYALMCGPAKSLLKARTPARRPSLGGGGKKEAISPEALARSTFSLRVHTQEIEDHLTAQLSQGAPMCQEPSPILALALRTRSAAMAGFDLNQRPKS